MPLKNREAILYGVLSLLLIAPFLVDLMVPLGTSVWAFYLIPTVLSFLSRKPLAPVVVGSIVSILVVTGFFLGRDGVDPSIAFVNRTIGLSVTWLLSGIGIMFIRNKLELERQDWMQVGQVGLANAIAGDLSVEQQAERMLRFLAEYLDAQAAAVFIRDEGGFVRRAVYGVPDTARIPLEIKPGDGLLGQAVQDRRNFLLADVPENYLYFGSSFGQAAPRQLLIAGARADDDVIGVIEMGFAGEEASRAEAFMSRVAGQLGVAIRSATYRNRLQVLLEETQQQAEELQAQGEELQANNEELEAQSQRLLESQARLETQQAELEESNASLENQAQELEAQRDELERAQKSLEQQTAELERASRYKSEFLANMSHELRTPLNSLLIMARLLAENRKGNLSPEQVKHASTIETSGNDLLNLINDILDISKIEAGKIDLDIRPTKISSLFEKLGATFSAAADAKGLKLRISVDPGLSGEIRTDPQRAEQVLKNFLSNAIKFTEDGEITLRAAAAEDNRIALSVRDTGIGIPPEKLDVIFEAFRQADGTVSRKYGGTGLGLSISRELAALLGGDVRVESAPGEGSIFTLVLPLVLEPSALESRPASTATARSLPARVRTGSDQPAPRHSTLEDDRASLTGNSRVILIVEDDAIFAGLLCDLAHEQGFECLIADTADEGVVLARQYLPHAIILDMNLPDHTGLSVLDRIKRDVRTRHIPVHIVSVSEDAQAALANGAVGYLLKPVKHEQLVDMLAALETRMAQRVRRVLVVEDDARQAESIGLLLGSQDVETVVAHSAAECLEKLSELTFDCMVLDLNLPDTSGFDLLERLSEDETIGFPPVIVYTGRDISAQEELRLRRYSKSIIVKGAKSPERLLDEVTLFLHQVVSELPEEQKEMVFRSLNRDAALDGKRILVVEDDIRNVYALTSVFEPHGATIRIARNGQEALDALDQSLRGEAPMVDLVLMDVMMPEMDGLTATRHIRGQSQWRNLPIIALTAKAMPRDQQDCIAAGANDYLSKPLDVDKLLSLVRVWMPR
ncbi:signal transduction histidine kinase/DNA-binding response OmpR family regulator [Sphingobium sp. B1D3A]|uniref:histidine kinase n=2 Tax=Sphingobium lignivorans TaxID=2735886 RepID=A0ABR6NCQ4_9SPHN|nr:signal transduction histidine kinase/DNA-binding response OmpR family regulator [Sphingobium lignivorans]